eukprot:gene10058-1814_t
MGFEKQVQTAVEGTADVRLALHFGVLVADSEEEAAAKEAKLKEIEKVKELERKKEARLKKKRPSSPPMEEAEAPLALEPEAPLEAHPEFEVVFLSCDRDQKGYDQHSQGMPWPKVPFGDESTQLLMQHFEVKGVPTLLVFNQHGTLVTSEGRPLVK